MGGGGPQIRGGWGPHWGAAIPAIATMWWATTKLGAAFTFCEKFLAEMGIEPERVRLEWISATEGRALRPGDGGIRGGT